jgi:single-strand DNA-binding protein
MRVQRWGVCPLFLFPHNQESTVMDNSVELKGNVVADPQMRFTSDGSKVTTFAVAHNPRVRKDDTWVDGEVSFFDVQVWDSQAENVAQTVTKGMRVSVSGRLLQKRWQAEDGSNRSKVVVNADDVSVSLKWATAQVVRVSSRRPVESMSEELSFDRPF